MSSLSQHDVGPNLSGACPKLANIAENWPGIDLIYPHWAKLGPRSAKCGPKSEVGHNSVNTGLNLPEFGPGSVNGGRLDGPSVGRKALCHRSVVMTAVQASPEVAQRLPKSCP